MTRKTLDHPEGQTAPGNSSQAPKLAGQPTGAQAPPASDAGRRDDVLAEIKAVLQGVSVPDRGVLGQAFKTTVRTLDETSAESFTTQLIDLGDLDGDGVPEIAVQWLTAGASRQDAGPSLWGPYLLSWDGHQWKSSSLGAPAGRLYFKVVLLGKGTGRSIAVVSERSDGAPFPVLYQVKEHAAALIWNSRAEESRYSGPERGQVEFRDNARLGQTDMIVTGRADPGLLEFQPGGRRGFTVRSVYRWNGQAYIPEQTEYAPGPDYTLYRFIAALHLRDFRNAYAEIDPAKFLHTNAPSLDKFHQMIKETYPEFLEDQIFRARETEAGSPDTFVFELPRLNYVYRPTLGDSGGFLLLDLDRKVEVPPSDSSETSQ